MTISAEARDTAPTPGPATASPVLSARNITYTAGEKVLVDNVSLELFPGQCWGIVGPNGAGKTTLLRLLCGYLKPAAGEAFAAGKPVDRTPPHRLARHLALVPQAITADLTFPVFDVVLMGRFIHNSRWRETSADRQAAAAALAATGASHLANRMYDTLSGGERQRVILARALAQETQILLLDEPTANLDPRYQLASMETVRRLVDTKGMAVMAALHDLTLAARYCHRLLLMDQGRVAAAGTPEQVLQPDILADVYGVKVMVERHPRLGHLVVLPDRLLAR